MRPRSFVSMGVTLLSMVLAQPAAAIPIHDESSQGDLSDDRLAPTPFVLAAGASEILGTVMAGDRDYWSIVVPSGHRLDEIIVLDYAGASGGFAFTGIQAGAAVTVDPGDFTAVGLLGWVLFGDGEIGTDVLDDMAVSGNGATGFVPPLGPGTYSVWTQETSTTPSEYVLSYVVTPEPSVLALGGLTLSFPLLLVRRNCRFDLIPHGTDHRIFVRLQ